MYSVNIGGLLPNYNIQEYVVTIDLEALSAT